MNDPSPIVPNYYTFHFSLFLSYGKKPPQPLLLGFLSPSLKPQKPSLLKTFSKTLFPYFYAASSYLIRTSALIASRTILVGNSLLP